MSIYESVLFSCVTQVVVIGPKNTPLLVCYSSVRLFVVPYNLDSSCVCEYPVKLLFVAAVHGYRRGALLPENTTTTDGVVFSEL